MTNKQYHTIKTVVKYNRKKACSGRDRMVVGFSTNYVFSAYHH